MLPDVIEIVCNHINDDWEDLACFIGVTAEFISRTDQEAELTETKMKMCLKEMRNNVSWKFLKMQLQKLGRLDIIEMLMDRTLLTIGEYILLKSLIHKYTKEYLNSFVFCYTFSIYLFTSVESP